MAEVELLTLLKIFKPYEFSEENYVSSPPLIMIENFNGHDLILVAMKERGLEALEKLSSNNGLNRIDKEVFMVDRLSMADALNRFSWLIRMGWKDERIPYLWSLLNSYMRTTEYDSPSSIMLNDFNMQFDVCLRKIGINSALEYSVMLDLLQNKLDEYLSKIPSTIYQKIVDCLCTYGESTVDQLFRRVLKGGVTISALYKALSKLKKENYVKVVKHVRISRRGPMKELLTSNCGKCLYNHSSSINCYKNTLNQLSAILKAFYGKALTSKDLEKLYIEFRSIPYPQRVIRRINEILLSLHGIKVKLDDKLTNSILTKIQSIAEINIVY